MKVGRRTKLLFLCKVFDVIQFTLRLERPDFEDNKAMPDRVRYSRQGQKLT